MPETGPVAYEFDVALSFAGEDRTRVEKIAQELKDRGLIPFYDNDHIVEMWGEDLYEYLDGVYRERARFAILFVSKHYVRKAWTNHERKSVQSRALESTHPYLLPIRIDDSTLPGLRSTIGYLDARQLSLLEIVDAIESKVKGAPGITIGVEEKSFRCPRSPDETRSMLTTLPGGWEYMLFAGIMLQEMGKLEGLYLDHEIGFAAPNGSYVGDRDIMKFISRKCDEARSITPVMEGILNKQVQNRAFGLPGDPGDPDRIMHLAKRVSSLYEEFLKWAANIRCTATPSQYRPVMITLSGLLDAPMHQVRTFILECVEQMDQVPEMLSSGKVSVIRSELILSIPENQAQDLNREIEKAGRLARKSK